MPGKDIVVIGASAGGIDALRTILGALPKDFSGSIFVVVHMAPDSPGVLARIFDVAGPLPAVYANDGDRIEQGRIYVAPADRHLIIVPGKVTLSRGPRENRFRPAIDPTFRSAAQTYGPRAVGVVLSGGLDDGTNGLWIVKQLGGTAIVQNPVEAPAPSMPTSAMQHVRVDHVVPVAQIAPLLVRLASSSADMPERDVDLADDVDIEVNIAKEENPKDAGVWRLGTPSNYACPECHGVLLQMNEESPLRFRCHTGHAYTLESLLSELEDLADAALWTAVIVSAAIPGVESLMSLLRPEQGQSPKIILTTTRPAASVPQGADRILLKPFLLEDLQTAITECCERRPLRGASH